MKEYLEFNQLEVRRKTKVFKVRNKKTGDYLGDIDWANGWRRYVFTQRTDFKIQMDAGCEIQIGLFLKALMEQRKWYKKE